jgi:hypothetical protein
MNNNLETLETTLRSAPTPVPPADLAAKLRSGIPQPSNRTLMPVRTSLWHRWWPVLVPGSALMALAAVVVIQDSELRRAADNSAPIVLHTVETNSDSTAGMRLQPEASEMEGMNSPHAELERLRLRVSELEARLADAQAAVGDPRQLEAELKSMWDGLSEDLRQAYQAKRRADSIRCVNNMKQLGLAVRIYATDFGDDFPPDLKSILPYNGSSKTFLCPEDVGKPNLSVDDLKALTSEQVTSYSSYEFLAPGPGKFETDPQRVMFRCPFHGHVALCDGSVQMIQPLSEQTKQPPSPNTKDTNGLETMFDGKLYFRPKAPESQPSHP